MWAWPQQFGSKVALRTRVNPITLLILWIAYLVLVFRAASPLSFLWLAGGLAVLPLSKKGSWRPVLVRMLPYLVFLPILIAGYLILTLLLTSDPVVETLLAAVPSGLRVFLLMAATAVFIEWTSSGDLLDALRTLWYRSRIRWRHMDDFFLLIYIALRFFPILKEEITGFMDADRALGLPERRGKLAQVRRWTVSLPGVIASCLNRADNLGMAMEIRGYGRILPRGIASPFSFSHADLYVLSGLVLFIAGFVFLAQL